MSLWSQPRRTGVFVRHILPRRSGPDKRQNEG